MSGSSIALERARIWIKAARLPFLTATIVPVVLGTAIAWYRTGSFDGVLFLVTLATVALAHLGTNMTNDYYDHTSGNDEANLKFSPFNGGSRMIQNGQIAARHVLYAALGCFGGAIVLGTLLLLLTGKVEIVLLGLMGILCGFFYTASPVRIGYRTLGELAVGLGFGPLVLVGSYWIQTFSFDVVAVAASVPVGILIMLVLLINEIPDYEADKSVGKKTLVVLLGRRRAARLYHGLLLLVYAFIGGMVLGGVFPIFCLAAVLLPLGIAHRAVTVCERCYAKYPEVLPANAATIALHFATGMLLAAGFVLSKVVGLTI